MDFLCHPFGIFIAPVVLVYNHFIPSGLIVVILLKDKCMETISTEFNYTDALLLYSTAYCQKHKYRATLGQILLTTDAVNRSMPMAFELEKGFSRLMAGGYVESQEDAFLATKRGMNLFDEVTKPRSPKIIAVQQIKNLVVRLNRSRAKTVTRHVTITDAQYSAAVKEAHDIFEEVRERMDVSRKLVKHD